MEAFLYIFAKTVSIVIGLVQLCMMARALMPFFFDVESSRLYAFACLISEPFVIPVRFVMDKLNIGQGSPIDWAFFTAYMLLALLETVLPII